MSRSTGWVLGSVLLSTILLGAGYATGQQTSPQQPKPSSALKLRPSQTGSQQNDQFREQLAQVQEQLKELKATVESIHADQQASVETTHADQESIKAGLDSIGRSGAQNSLNLAEITHTLAENRKAIDGIDRELQLMNHGVDLTISGVGLLVDRTTTLPTDIQQIKTRLGIY